MMSPTTKKQVLRRLRRAEGQMAAIRRMVEEDEGCVDVLLQISAVRGALSKAGQLLLGSHLETCVKDAFMTGEEELRRQQISELMEIFSRYGGLAAR